MQTGTRCSVFLCPGGDDLRRCSDLIRAIAAEEGSRPFEPHLTLRSGWADDADLLCREVKKICREQAPLVLRLRRVASTEEYFRSLFFEFEWNPRIDSLHERLARLIRREEERPFVPHLSLMYKEMPLEEKERLAAGIRPWGEEMLFDRLQVTVLDDPKGDWGDIGRWRSLFSARLKGERGTCAGF